MTGDAADAAFDAGSDEVSSQLAQLEARELNLIDRAIARIKNGTFGTCEGCGHKIPVARLNALPYSSMCIECQQDAELHGGWGDGTSGDWGKVYDAESSYEERHVDLADLEADTAAAR
jgi:DnaK suppressor protein